MRASRRESSSVATSVVASTGTLPPGCMDAQTRRRSAAAGDPRAGSIFLIRSRCARSSNVRRVLTTSERLSVFLALTAITLSARNTTLTLRAAYVCQTRFVPTRRVGALLHGCQPHPALFEPECTARDTHDRMRGTLL